MVIIDPTTLKLTNVRTYERTNELTNYRTNERTQGFKEELRQWDVSFWAERLREDKYNITDEELRPYFALPNVLEGLFQVWPSPARAFSVFNAVYRSIAWCFCFQFQYLESTFFTKF